MRKIAIIDHQRDYMNRHSEPFKQGAAGLENWSLINLDVEAYRDSLTNIWRSPEDHLLLAVLEDAIYLVRFPKHTRYGTEKGIVDDAREWFASDKTDWPFDFLVICEHFSLSPVNIRLGLATCHAKKGRTPNPHIISRSQEALTA